MIEAVLNGKTKIPYEDNEDIFTSTTFGYLKYMPTSFWIKLLEKAKNIGGTNFTKYCKTEGVPLDDIDKIQLYFWKRFENYGEPDIIVKFSSSSSNLEYAFIIEVKLYSRKSGSGKDDQLNKYFKLLRSKAFSEIQSSKKLGIIYLTPRRAIGEIQDSINYSSDKDLAKKSYFHLQWQDVYEVAKVCTSSLNDPYNKMALDVSRFLDKCDLTYFNGFKIDKNLDISIDIPIRFYKAINRFNGFTCKDFETIDNPTVLYRS